MSEATKALVAEREATHGDFAHQSSIAQGIKELLKLGERWEEMPAPLREVGEMIATKLARFVCGDPLHPDHLRDIAGYADRGLDFIAEIEAARE